MKKLMLTSNRRYVSVLTGIVVTTMLGTIFLVFSQRSQMSDSQLNTETTLQSMAQPTNSPADSSSEVYLPSVVNNNETPPISDLSDSWLKYVDEKLGFSINYPANWFFELNEDFRQPNPIPDVMELRVMFASFPPPFLGPADSIQKGCNFHISVATTQVKAASYLESNRYDFLSDTFEAVSETEINIKGIAGLRREYAASTKLNQPARTTVLLADSKNIFSLYFWTDDVQASADCSAIYESMLQSFHVID